MAAAEISDLTELTSLADADLLVAVDASDTTASVEGTTKKITATNARSSYFAVEGTFTPGIAFGGGATGITYTTQTGHYTKIGNRVFFDINIVLSAKGSSTGSAAITGLPFTPATSLASYICRTNIAAIVVVVRTNADTTLVFENSAGSGALSDTSFAATTSVRVTGGFRV
jgi:hypothetical protein